MGTKELIQEAALDLFSRKGFDSSSVRDIAVEYYSPVFLFFNQYMNHVCTEKDTEQFKQAVMSAAGSFLQTYRKEN